MKWDEEGIARQQSIEAEGFVVLQGLTSYSSYLGT